MQLQTTDYLDREIREHCSQFVEQVRLLTPLDRVAVILFDQELSSSRVAFYWRAEEALLSDPEPDCAPAPSSAKEILNLPLYDGEGRIGTALLHSQAGISLGRQEIQMVYRISEELAIRLENAELAQRLQAREVELAVLARDLEVATANGGSGQSTLHHADLAHTLRSPLTSIKGYTSSLLRTDVSWSEELEREFLETIDREADRLNQAVTDLLDSSRHGDIPG